MTALNKQALREAAEKALPAMQRLLMMPNDELFDEALLNVDGDVDAANAFNLNFGPETALALLDALEAAENNLIDSECHVAELEESLRDKQALLEALDNSLCELLPGTQYMDPPDGGSVTPLEQVRRMVADYRNRIAELESRTVKLPTGTEVNGFQMLIEEEVIARLRESGVNPIVVRAAGIGVKGE